MFATLKFRAARKLLNSLVVVGSEGDKKEEISVARVLLLCRYFGKGED